MRLIILLVVVSLWAVSCKEQPTNHDRDIVKVNGNVLSADELNQFVPSGLSYEDSIIASELFIKQWIIDNLVYENAKKNISDKEEIDVLVEDYRKSLVIYRYKEKMINERLSKETSEEALLEYYNLNKDKFQLDRVLVKGLFIKVPVDAPDIAKLKRWCMKITPSSIKSIEDYCIKNGIGYNYVTEDWIDFNELMNTWSLSFSNKESDIVKSNRFIERKEEQYTYLLNITDYLLPGDNAPFEYARKSINELLVNRKKIDFMNKLENDLYTKAVNSGDVIFYNEQINN